MYAGTEISTRMALIGMREYHNEMQWLWTTGLVLLAESNESRRKRLISALAALLDGEEWISEVYLGNKPFRNLWYRSEEPFAWSAGMILAGLIESDLGTAFARIRE